MIRGSWRVRDAFRNSRLVGSIAKTSLSAPMSNCPYTSHIIPEARRNSSPWRVDFFTRRPARPRRVSSGAEFSVSRTNAPLSNWVPFLKYFLSNLHIRYAAHENSQFGLTPVSPVEGILDPSRAKSSPGRNAITPPKSSYY